MVDGHDGRYHFLPLLTTDEAAEILRVHRSTLLRWRKGGGGPRYARVGRFIMYTQDALDAWLAERSESHEE